MLKYVRVAHLVAVSAFAMVATAAAAQTTDTAAADGANEPATGEIIVTANRRAQRATDVGIALSVLDPSVLQNKRVVAVEDLANVVPGLSVGNSGYSTPLYSLRGVGVNEPTLGSGSSVAVYQDEVPLTLPIMTRGAAFDLERLEVVKGPQGTLYGQNATGGAINYIAAKPTNSFQAGLIGSFGRFADASAEGYISGPLSNTLKGRIAIRGERSDGWQTSLSHSGTIGKIKKLQGRAILAWEPAPTFHVTANVNGWLDKSDNLVPKLVAVIGSGTTQPSPRVLAAPKPGNDPRVTDWDQGVAFNADDHFLQGSVRADWDVADDITITSITALSHTKINSYNEYDGMGVSALDGLNINDTAYRVQGKVDSFTQEGRVTAKLGQLTWVAGANYTRDRTAEDDLVIAHDLTQLTAIGITEAGFINRQQIRSFGIFTNLEFKVTPELEISGGIRYSKETRNFQGCTHDLNGNSAIDFWNNSINARRTAAGLPVLTPSQRVTVGQCYSTNPDLLPGLANKSLTEDNVPWNVNINYHPASRTLIYARVSKGYKSGNFPAFAAITNASYTQVKQESVQAYEVGFKWDANSFISAEGALFQYDYKDKQQRGRIDSGPPFGLVASQVNIPKARIKGAELSVTVRPVEGLSIAASGVYLDSKILQYTGYNIDGLLVNMKGFALNLTPKYSANVDCPPSAPMAQI